MGALTGSSDKGGRPWGCVLECGAPPYGSGMAPNQNMMCSARKAPRGFGI